MNYALSDFECALLKKHTSKMERPYCGCDEPDSYIQFEIYICVIPIYCKEDDLGIQMAMASCKTCSMVTFLHLQHLGLQYSDEKGLTERIIT